MVHVTLADDTSSVTLPSGTVTGPLSFWADTVSKGGTDYSEGILVVQAGVAHVTSHVGPAHAQAWPYMFVLLFAFALITLRVR